MSNDSPLSALYADYANGDDLTDDNDLRANDESEGDVASSDEPKAPKNVSSAQHEQVDVLSQLRDARKDFTQPQSVQERRRVSQDVTSSLSAESAYQFAQMVQLEGGEGVILYYPKLVDIEVGDVLFLRERQSKVVNENTVDVTLNVVDEPSDHELDETSQLEPEQIEMSGLSNETDDDTNLAFVEDEGRDENIHIPPSATNTSAISAGQENGVIVQIIEKGTAAYPQADSKALFRLMTSVRAEEIKDTGLVTVVRRCFLQ